jgi:hypothetical protein
VTVRGRVTDQATGKPITGALVDYQPLYRNPYVNKKLAGAWSPRSETTTGPDGSYVLTVFPGPGVIGVIGDLGPNLDKYMPGHVTREEVKAFFKSRAVIFPGGLAPDAGGNLAGGQELAALYNAYVLLEPGENEKTLVKDVALEAPHERRGRVVGPDGRPLAGVAVRGRKTGARGEFTLRGLNPRQRLEVVFYHKEKNLGFFLKEPPGQQSDPLTVKLQPCGSVSGRLVDVDGQPLANKRLHILDDGSRFDLVTADKEGRFRIEGLVPGVRYTLTRQQLPEVNYELAQPSLATVSVEPGKTKDLGDLKVEH